MPRLADRVQETSTTTGTGDFTLAGAVTGFRAFNPTVEVGERFWYAIEGGAEWETGIGYLSATTTLVRETVNASSNSGSLVNFSAGTKSVFITPTDDALRSAAQGRTWAIANRLTWF